jgi:YHS domain-containing protein
MARLCANFRVARTLLNPARSTTEMNLDTIKSLVWWLVIGALFFWMMRRGGCGMMAVGPGRGQPRSASDGDRRSASGPPVDPVCGMEIAPARAAGTRVVDGQTFFFCSAMCLETFDKNQETYLHAAHDGTTHGHQHAGC